MVGAATVNLLESKHVRTRGTATNYMYSLMNEVYETEHRLLFQCRVKIGRLSSRDSFVRDAGDLKLDARLDRQ